MIASKLLEAAVAGDETADAELVESHRGALHAHCYRLRGRSAGKTVRVEFEFRSRSFGSHPVAGLAGHGLEDLWQHRSHFVANTRWWPQFCMVVDWVVAAIIVGEIAVGTP